MMDKKIKNNVKAALAIGSLVCAFSVPVQADLNTGLVAHYSFDDCTAKDVTGNGYDGVIQGTPSCETTTQGKGLYLNKSGSQGQYIVLPTFDAIWSTGFSVCGLVRLQNARFWERIIDFGNGRGKDNILVARESTTNRLDVHSYVNNSVYALAKGNAITRNVSKQYCVTIDNTQQQMALYIQGDKVSQIAGSIANVARSLNYIGHSNWLVDSDTQGIFDDILIYSRALSAIEVKNLYIKAITDISGTLAGFNTTGFSVQCQNITTGQSVSVASVAFNCEAAGLVINPNDVIHINIDGKVK